MKRDLNGASFLSKKIVTLGILGVSSGAPLPLTASTLQAYLTVYGIDLRLIGLFSSLSFPYTLKFLWAPIFDRISAPFIGRRRGFILLSQLTIFLLIASYSLLNPVRNLKELAFISFLLSLFSATQDILIDAYRTDILDAKERPKGASIFITGYRIGMLSSSAFALIIADKIGWDYSFIFISMLILFSITGTLLGSNEPDQNPKDESLFHLTLSSVRELLIKERSFLLLLFIATYKLGDAYLGAMTVPFLISGANFSPSDVGLINKALGFGFTLAGAICAGFIMSKIDLWRSLFYFGILQMVSNLFFILLSLAGKNYPLLCICVAIENFSGGMGTSAFITLIMSLCSRAYSGTQFALLSSLSAIGRVLISPTSGFFAQHFGWIPFFILSALFALPGMITLIYLRGRIEGGNPPSS